ncbi:hypothetical protein [Streptomyces sp. NPDC004546]|uniref:hypothetical protein n=1 Tax=Streptomyces sp. NPDC004546 TaxID=3154282 RepID=UPI0033BFAF68
MTTGPENLSEIFSKPTAGSVPNRGAGLGSLVPGRQRGRDGQPGPQPGATGAGPQPPAAPTREADSAKDVPAPSGADAPAEAPPGGQDAGGTPAESARIPAVEAEAEVEDEDDENEAEAQLARSKQRTTLYVSPSLHRRFEKYVRAKRGRTNTSVVLEAIAAKRSETRKILKDSRVTVAAGNDLFPEDPRAVRYLGAGPVQIQIAPTMAQLRVLENLTTEYGFEARATWIAPVLNDFLPGRKERLPD